MRAIVGLITTLFITIKPLHAESIKERVETAEQALSGSIVLMIPEQGFKIQSAFVDTVAPNIVSDSRSYQLSTQFVSVPNGALSAGVVETKSGHLVSTLLHPVSLHSVWSSSSYGVDSTTQDRLLELKSQIQRLKERQLEVQKKFDELNIKLRKEAKFDVIDQIYKRVKQIDLELESYGKSLP